MAGAVSAGAYTAGVFDYLIESLQRWEEAKHRNRELLAAGKEEEIDQSVPMHDVVIDVFGGASAGGMTAAIATLGLYEGGRPVYEDGPEASRNRLFDAWVNLNDGAGMDTMQQMLGLEDLKQGRRAFLPEGYSQDHSESGKVKRSDRIVASLLNSQAIDAIANRAVGIQVNRRPGEPEWPSYIAENLEVILTICTLRGVPIELNFGEAPEPGEKEGGEVPAHRMYMHKSIAHFTIDESYSRGKDHLLGLNLATASDQAPGAESEEEAQVARKVLIECAKATGAFPLGLQPRVMEAIPHAYIKAHIIRTFGNPDININWARIPDDFTFTAIDGGTINNEPFDDVIRVLEERYGEDVEQGRVDPEKEDRNYAIIMIDPFPSTSENEQQADYEPAVSVGEVTPLIISAIRRQAMIKEQELSRGFTGDYTRAMVFPVRRSTGEDGKEQKEEFAIACGALDGFGGFFSREFRVHDFFLGRKNAQSFLRKHFSLSRDHVFVQNEQGEEQVRNPLFAGWKPGDPRYERFQYLKGGVPYFPIIPDLRIRDANADDPALNGQLPAKDYPSLSLEKLRKLRRPIRRRVDGIIRTLLWGSLFGKKKTVAREEKDFRKEVKHAVNRHLGSAWYLRYAGYALLLLIAIIFIALLPFILLLYSLLLSWLVRQVFTSIVYDFKKRGLVK